VSDKAVRGVLTLFRMFQCQIFEVEIFGNADKCKVLKALDPFLEGDSLT
jgi:hypothetical protein